MADIFIGSEAIAAGRATRYELQRWHTSVFRGVYAPRGVALTLRNRATAAWLASGRKGVIAGPAAAALLGSPYVDSDQPVELVGVKMRPQQGLVPRPDRIRDDEITRVGGLPVTTRVRTAFDMGRHLERTEALFRLDALMWNQRYSIDEVRALMQRYPRASGRRRLDELLPLVDGGAASPTESRIRLWLHDAGFPPPETQIPVLIGSRPVAWLDIGWPEYDVAVEYDGDHHRKNRHQYVKDIARLRMLEDLGWIVIRAIAEDRPQDVIARVESALVSRGCLVEISELQRFTRSLAA